MKENITFADPLTRFIAYIIDSLIVFIALFIVISVLRYKGVDVDLYPEKENEVVEINVNSNNKTKELTNNQIEINQTNNNEKTIEKSDAIVLFGTKVKTAVYLLIIKIHLVISFIYCMIFLNSKKQATIGQQIFGLMTINIKTGKVKILDSFTIFFARMIMNYSFYIGYITVLFTKDKITAYDFISSSRVIKISEKINNR